VRQRGGDVDVDIAVEERRVAGEVDDAIVVGAASQIARALDGAAGDQDALARPAIAALCVRYCASTSACRRASRRCPTAPGT
jgi:hypothetical protein